MLDMLVNFIFTIINFIANFFTGIIIETITFLIPDLEPIFINISSFLNVYVYDMLGWIKRVIINVFCIPQEIFSVLILLISGKLLVAGSLRIYFLILNIWALFHGNTSPGLIPTIDDSVEYTIT